jgi:hypothetical protein
MLRIFSIPTSPGPNQKRRLMRQLVESAKKGIVVIAYKAQEAKHKRQLLIPAPAAGLYSYANWGPATSLYSCVSRETICNTFSIVHMRLLYLIVQPFQDRRIHFSYLPMKFCTRLDCSKLQQNFYLFQSLYYNQ